MTKLSTGWTFVKEEGQSDDEDAEQKRLESSLRAQRSFADTRTTQSFADTRLRTLLTAVRKMPDAKLKEQCVRAEWSALDSELDREVLTELVQDAKFWAEVKAMALADLAAIPEEAEGEMDIDTRLAQMFACFDKDKSGSIDSSELHQMLLYMGVSASESEVREMIRQVDKNGDGDIDLEEFLIVMKNAQSGQMGIAPVRKNTIRRASIKLQQEKKSLTPIELPKPVVKSQFWGQHEAAPKALFVEETTPSAELLPPPSVRTVLPLPQAAPLTPMTNPLVTGTPPQRTGSGLKKNLSSPKMTSSQKKPADEGRSGSISSSHSGKDIPSYMRGTQSRGK